MCFNSNETGDHRNQLAGETMRVRRKTRKINVSEEWTGADAAARQLSEQNRERSINSNQ